MKGYRFYLEYRSSHAKRKREGSGNSLALFTDPEHRSPRGVECLAAVFDEPNSPCATTSVSRDILRKNYRRCTEAEARLVHPELFVLLDRPD